jgi:hypothetical protein
VLGQAQVCGDFHCYPLFFLADMLDF